MDQHPAGAPISPLFCIKQTPHSGRAVFATQSIPEGTPLSLSDDLAIHVLFREYRREVCGRCFAYDRGVEWRVRDAKRGFVFCSEECKLEWREEAGEVGCEAWATVEKLIKNRSKEDIDLVDVDAPQPRKAEWKAAWADAEKQAALVRMARLEGSITKQHRKAVQQAIARPVSCDILPLLLAAVLLRYQRPEAWEAVLGLAADSFPYKSTEELTSHTNSYLHLLAVLPVELLEFVTPMTLVTVLSRDSHNSFGIRSLDDGGSEYFGYGVWPAASYYNHSCDPNVAKQRIGRVWKFTTARDIREGEELCITYLNNEERELSVGKRILRLKKFWGFDCACTKCNEF